MAREYRDSGIEWIGQIPKEWKTCRLKDVGTLYGGLTGKAGDDFNVEEDDMSYMLYIPFTNIFNNDSINPCQLFKVKIEQGEKQNLVQKGDLLFLMSSEDYDGVGKPAIMEEQIDNLGLNSFCKGLRIHNSNTNGKFLFYLLSSHLHRELVRQEAKGFIRINLRQDRLSCCPIFLPSFSEQQKIADYLDKVCGEVDEMVALQETMIEELKAYKQSVITEAVTKGLNPNAPMRNSGIDWIGEIPEGWKIVKTKKLFDIVAGATPKTDQNDFWDEDIPWITPADYKTENKYISKGRRNISKKGMDACATYLLPINSIVFSKRAPIGLVAITANALCTNQGCLGCLYNEHSNTCYYYYAMSAFTKQYDILGTGTTFKEISATKFANFPLPSPPLSEQQAIASYLDTKCSEIDSLISLKQAKIEELKEYKKSIIYEYVTGKKEVV